MSKKTVITFLHSTTGINLNKTIQKNEIKHFTSPKLLTSREVEINSPLEFYNKLVHFAAMPAYCLFTGKFKKPLQSESRSKKHINSFEPSWVCLDFDGLKGYTVNTALHELSKVVPELKTTSHVIQYSSSSLVFGDTSLRAHVFFMFDQPVQSNQLQNWLYNLNLTTKLKDQISLTASMNGLHWPLDPVLGQNSRLIFIAPPVFVGGVHDPYSEKETGERIQFVQKENDFLPSLSVETTPAFPVIQQEKLKVLNRLRQKKGLTRKSANAVFGQVNKNPDAAQVTGVKEDGDFVRLNLNGGDSWGYYYNKDNPEFLYNFKGEPNYPLKKIVPEYWNEHFGDNSNVDNKSPDDIKDEGELIEFAFREKETYKCYWVEVDFRSNSVRQTANKNNVLPASRFRISEPLTDSAMRVYLKKHQSYTKNPQDLLEMDLIWDPNPKLQQHIDIPNSIVNTYVPTELIPTNKANPQVPKWIKFLLMHLMVNSELEYNKFLDWLAWIVQKRTKTKIAWIFYGVPGTGKGLMVEKILQPLLHRENVKEVTNKVISEKFTEPVVNNLITIIDEADASLMDVHDEARFKNWITQPYIQHRPFGKKQRTIKHHTNFIFCSNAAVPVKVTLNDRRYNVAPYQKQSLDTVLGSKKKISTKLIPGLELGITEFYQFLLQRKVTEASVSTPLNTIHKRKLAENSQTITSLFFNSITQGDPELILNAYKEIERQSPSQYAMTKNIRPLAAGIIQINAFKKFVEEFVFDRKPFVLTIDQINACLPCVTNNAARNTARLDKLLTPLGLEMESLYCPKRDKRVTGIMFPLKTEEEINDTRI